MRKLGLSCSLLIAGFCFPSCTIFDGYWVEPESGEYNGSDGQKYEIDAKSPRFVTLKDKNGLCVSFGHLKSDPDKDGNLNLKGYGCKDYVFDGEWTGKFSTKETDRFQFTQPDGKTLEIIYVDE